MGLYRSFFRPLFFRADAERIHAWAICAAEAAGSFPALCARLAAHRQSDDDRLAVDIAGLKLPSPIGLAAGFDKSARAVHT